MSLIVPALVPRLCEGVTKIDVVVHIRQQQLQAQPSGAVSEPEDVRNVMARIFREDLERPRQE